jgi:hypothetical protein
MRFSAALSLTFTVNVICFGRHCGHHQVLPWYRPWVGTLLVFIRNFLLLNLKHKLKLKLKSTTYWDISQARNQREAGGKQGLCFHTAFFFRLFLRPWIWRRYVPPKRRLTLNGLHGVISQNMVLFKILPTSQNHRVHHCVDKSML